MHNAISDISTFDLEGRDVDWLVQRIKFKLQASTFRLDFFAFAQEYIKGKNGATYTSAVNAFAQYRGQAATDINDITKTMIQGFAEWCESQKKVCKSRRVKGWVQERMRNTGCRNCEGLHTTGRQYQLL